MPSHILLIEDEPGLVLTLRDRLQSKGYDVTVANDGEEGFRRATTSAFDLLILDLMLPRKSGLEVCRDLRDQGFAGPILMLTARGLTADKVLGLKTGADDYLTKPFEMPELLARVEALIRRSSGTVIHGTLRQFGAVRVDLQKGEVTREGEPQVLSGKEFQLLRYFLEHANVTLSREQLLHEVWGYESAPSTRTVDVHVAWLRQKLEPDSKRPQWILTVHGSGYKFVSN